MKRFFFLTTIFVVVLFFIPRIVSGAVVINEIMYDLEGSDTDREWVEVFNNSDTAVDLTDWKLWEGGTNHKLTAFRGGAVLSPNAYAVIADKPDKFLIDNPSYSGIIFDSTFSLSNEGENLILKDKNLITIDEVLYSSSWGAKGNGRSLQRKDPAETNWGSGVPTPGALNNISPEEAGEETKKPETPTIPMGNNPPIAEAGDNIIAFINQEIKFDGTKSSDPDNDELAYSWNMGDGKLVEKPGFAYKYNYPGTYLVTLMVYDGFYYVSDTITVKIQTGQITINEFLPNPSGKDEEEEWIEIYNDSDSIVDISGWQLDDIVSGSQPFVFSENTLIAPKSYIVFSRQITGIALNNDKDSVRLLLPEGVVFQEINYEKPPLGKSSARTPEGFVWSEPTPGLANIISPSTISEITNKKFVYQQPIKSELTKELSQEYVINYQNANQPEIEGGYAVLPSQEQPQQEIKSQLATAKESISKQSPLQLILIIAAIIVAGLIIGLVLVRFRKKYP
ncbi:MAG: lamin tail domain-containing protein [Patescibacteria group bacterium]